MDLEGEGAAVNPLHVALSEAQLPPPVGMEQEDVENEGGIIMNPMLIPHVSL